MKDGAAVKPATLAAQALGWIEPTTRAIVPPIHPATTFERDPDNQYRSGRIYGRPDCPSYDQAEQLLSRLEGGAASMLLASGMAAASAVFLALKPGDHVVVPRLMYWGLRKWLLEFAKPWGLDVEFIETDDPAALGRVLRPGKTRLVWIETPANPTWIITDIAAAARQAHEAGALLAVDSTVSSPVITRPIEHGADIVMHAATKYLNGHSDVVAGTLTTARIDEFWARLKYMRTGVGGILGPFESWLLLRGMRTLHLRVKAASASALAIARRFQGDPRLVDVLYPGLPNSPGHEIARRQMTDGFGGMMSIRVKGGASAAIGVAARLEIFKRATSLGGVESLVEHRASVEGPGTPVPDDLLRLSVGIEDVDDLIGDLDRALG
jgi:cystathionine gamma-synthase